MKAKSKVLLGMIVALAMMVFAVPAFAAISFELSEIDAPATVYQGKTFTASIDVSLTDDTAKCQPYKAELEDVTPNATAPKKIFEKQTLDSALTAEEGTITFTDKTVAADATEGDHTLRLTVTDKSGNALYKEVTVKVAKAITAEYTGVTATTTTLTKAAEKGKAIGINAVAANNDSATTTYTWQMGDPAKVNIAKANNPAETTGWTTVADQTGATFNKAAAMTDDEQLVRCIVADGSGQKVVASTNNTAGTPAPVYFVVLSVTDPTAITFTSPAEDSSETITAGDAVDQGAITPAAKVGETALTKDNFTWKVNGENVASANIDAQTGALKADAFAAVKDTPGVYVYTCEATKDDLKATSPSFTLTVLEKPVVRIAKAVDTTNAHTGKIYFDAEDLKDEQTFTAEIDNPDNIGIKNYKWSVADKPVLMSPTATSYTGKVAADQQVVCEVEFKDIPADATNYKYTATVTATSGTLDGAIYTSTTSGTNPNPDPTYTITLPEGVTFTNAVTAANFVEEATDNSEIIINKNGLTVTMQGTQADGDTSVQFKLSTATALTNPKKVPYVENMTITVEQGLLTFANGVTAADIVLPVSDSVGYKITKAISAAELKADPDTKVYDGQPIEVEVVPEDATVKGVGEISDYRYAPATVTSATDPLVTTTAPTDKGTYAMFVDVADGEQWGGADDLRLKADNAKAFEITQAGLAAVEAKPEAYFTWTEEKDFTGKDQQADVAFADGITKAGKITGVDYYQGTTKVTPNAPGVYDIYVKTDGTDDECANVAALKTANTNKGAKIGTFTINKAAGQGLYTLKETEAAYTGEAIVPEITVKEGAGAVKATHYFKEGDTTKELTAIVQPGKYDVYVDSEEGTTYAAVEMEKVGTFTIKEQPVDAPTIYINPHVENIGWAKESSELKAGESIDAGTTGQGLRVEAVAFIVPEDYKVVGFAHVQNEGDVDVKKVESSSDYDIPKGYVAYEFGSTGKGQRVEAVCIGLQDASGEYVKGFQYATHLQNYGWQGFVRNGSFSGTRGMGLRMESIRFTYADPDVVKPGEPSGSLLK